VYKQQKQWLTSENYIVPSRRSRERFLGAICAEQWYRNGNEDSKPLVAECMRLGLGGHSIASVIRNKQMTAMMVTACDTTINSSAMKTGNFNHGYSRQQLQKRTSQSVMAYADMNLHNHLSLLFPTSMTGQ
jgi:hypothetical protein